MDFLFFWGLILLTFVLIASGLIFLSYWIPKRLGKKRVGKVLALIVSITLILSILYLVFQDMLFFKSDVRELLKNHDIQLVDDFKIILNESGGFMDYYHRFEIEISERDKEKIIQSILNSQDFKTDGVSLPNEIGRYSNKVIKADYEEETYFRRETYQTFEQGYAPTHEIITIEKKTNKLTFEQIID